MSRLFAGLSPQSLAPSRPDALNPIAEWSANAQASIEKSPAVGVRRLQRRIPFFCLSQQRLRTVDPDRCSGDMARRIGRQEQRQLRDIVGGPRFVVQRDVALEFAFDL